MKISKKHLKKLIIEEIGGMPSRAGEGNVYPGAGYTRNFPNGQPQDNNTYEPYAGRDPYELGGDEQEPKDLDGELYVTDGKNVYMLQFTNRERTAGTVTPVGQFGFTIDNGVLNWFDTAPPHVRFSSKVEKQVLDFSGRE